MSRDQRFCGIADCENLHLETGGQEVKVTFRREGQTKELNIVLNPKNDVINGKLT